MNLKEVYEIFYPGKCEKLPSVWIEGVYSMVWQIMKKDGTPAFSKNRRLEVLLNLI